MATRKAKIYLRSLGRLAWIYSAGLLRKANRRLIPKLDLFLARQRHSLASWIPPDGEHFAGGAHPRWVTLPERSGPVGRGAVPWAGSADSLDAIARRHGTDKSSLRHGYTRWYERELGHLRAAPVSLLEVGVLDGASLRAWREYFPAGRVHGVDVDEACRQIPGVFIGDQADPAFLRAVAAQAAPFDIVVDDGSHAGGDQLASFLALWPDVKPGEARQDPQRQPGEPREQRRGPGAADARRAGGRVRPLLSVARVHLEDRGRLACAC